MMLGVAGAVGEFMVLLAEAAAESGLAIAGSAALGVGVAAGAYALIKRVRKKESEPGKPGL
ncbi:hypothetical protein FHS31_001878 [Sphingomonas vulcanisoli]|uniref:Uncharacterized protein n=1 Tax=Sphingomonas vulcanisoli TaxID=1658060 RepID=A0ABX0TX96_9SPHN|nr:hypothetical protein [Sphingomonas vulcanisoli]NIJ08261.1 hypothetical protein [Sphingomonas vulcanisoli]